MNNNKKKQININIENMTEDIYAIYCTHINDLNKT